MFRRSAIAAGALAAAGALLVSTAGSASADISLPIGGLPVGTTVPTCSVTFHAPATLSISTTNPVVPLTLSVSGTLCPVSTAVLSDGAHVTLVSPSGSRTVATWQNPADTVRPSVRTTTYGSFTTTDGHASLVDGALNLPIAIDHYYYSTTRAKFASRSEIGAKRSGRVYTFIGYVKRYDPAHISWTGTAGRAVYLQKLTGQGWRNVTKVNQGSSGAVQVKIRAAHGQYRWSTSETSTSWAASSRAISV